MMLAQTEQAKAIALKKLNGEYLNPYAVEQTITMAQATKPKLPHYALQKRFNVRFRDFLLAWLGPNRLILLGAWFIALTATWQWLPTWFFAIDISLFVLPFTPWLIVLSWKAASFASVVTSGEVGPMFIEEDGIPRVISAQERIAERDNTCEGCEQKYVYIRLDGETSEHCQACKCPPTRWSENRYRNTLAGWHCPLRKHAGPYPNDGQAGALKGLGYEENAVLSAVGGGCTGCGCGKAAK